ncbi:MAG TPA: DUF948 domain-containing protein [Gemmatimonadales bacterium]
MISWSAAGLWLLQPGTLPDTQIVRQVTADPGLFQKITSVASGLMTISILVLTVALVPAAWNFRKSYKKVNDLLDRVYGDINPIMRHASVIADNLNYVTTSLRSDVQQVNQTVGAANERVLQAVRITERRLNEFNALLGVVQDEAEQVFVTTAAAVRGVRTGAYRLGDDLRLDQAEERIEEFDEELAEALDEAFDTGEEYDDGSDDPNRPPSGAEYPRIRPRGRS